MAHRLIVELLDHRLVEQQRREIAALNAELVQLKTRYNRLEFLYRCECHNMMELLDFCRDHGVKLPRRLLEPPHTVFDGPD